MSLAATLARSAKPWRVALHSPPLFAWIQEVERAQWTLPAQIRDRHPRASIVGKDRVIFSIRGNAYRLAVKMDYSKRVVFIRFVGTHAEYNRIDAREV